MSDITRIGFIGAGKMGGGVARRLATGGYSVSVYDPSPRAVEACTQAGAKAADTAEAAVAGAQVVFTSLPLPEHVIATYRTIIGSLEPGATCIDISTIDPTTARLVSDEVTASGAVFVSCPLGKGPAQAEEGQIPLFVGGPRETVDALMPMFERIGNDVHYLGEVEVATTFKLVSNVIGMTNLAVLAEGYGLAARAGMAPEAFVAALKATGGWSYQADVRLAAMMDGDHSPRFAVDLAVKDLRLALETAYRYKLPTPVSSMGLAQMISASAHGYGSDDVTAVVELLDPAQAADRT